MTSWVSDETWAQLDPNAGRLGPRDRKVVLGIVVIALLVVGLNFAAARSGVITPHLVEQFDQLTVPAGRQSFIELVSVSTSDSVDQRITSVRSRTPGLRVAATPLPVTIRDGSGQQLKLRFTVTDCAAARDHDVTIVLDIDRFWGTVSRTVTQRSGSDLPVDPIARACGF